MDGKCESGITGLDELLGGGFPAGGTYAIAGASGTGKSILSFEFLINGAVKFNEPGVCILLEEDRERMLSDLRGFNWDVRKLETAGKLKVIPYIKSIIGDVEATFESSMLSGEDGRANKLREYLTVDSLFKEVEQSCRTIGAKRVVIDSLTAITLLAENQLVARMQTLWLIEKLRKLNVTTLVTVEEGISYWNDMLFLCDGIVSMMLRERSGIFERGLLIEKMRGTAHDTGVRPLKITPDGVTVYPNEVIAQITDHSRKAGV
ncbi:MAG: ATPase domain-containing protein [Candidatus Altiarchaeota archaeon]